MALYNIMTSFQMQLTNFLLLILHQLNTFLVTHLFFKFPAKNSLYCFLLQAKSRGRLLDVGCGIHSPRVLPAILPSYHYTGIDIIANNDSVIFPNLYFFCEHPDKFSDDILNLPDNYDIIICNHNLEHCNNMTETILAMCKKLNNGGMIYIAVPSESSVNFPNRPGCLNYYDDATHKGSPPNTVDVCTILRQNGLQISCHTISDKPTLHYLIGLLQEPLSRLENKVQSATWAYYGFESIIWARKPV